MSGDRWSRWLLGGRDAGDPRQRELTLDWLRPVRERVLELAGPLEGQTLLDVGTGDGLIGREARARGARVIFSDVSGALLEHLAATIDGADLLQTSAEDLAGVPDHSIDIVTTRSVLIYVEDKAAAFAAMRRVLRPGGRISLFEPINALMFPEPAGRLFGYALPRALSERVAAEFPGDPAMVGFDDRDLVRYAEAAGFEPVHAETHHDLARHDAVLSLDTLLDGSPNPNAPTVREAIERALDPDEQEAFLDALGAAVARGPAVRRTVAVYLSAVAPA